MEGILILIIRRRGKGKINLYLFRLENRLLDITL